MKLKNLYTYAFLETPTVDFELPLGIGSSIIVVSCDRISAIVEPEVSLEALQSDDRQLIKAVLSHDKIVCELFRQVTILPLRFGTSFPSKESLLTHLESHAEEYIEKLRQLNSKAEYTLKFIPCIFDEPETTPEAGGRQYFLAKKQRYKAQQEFQLSQSAEWENIVNLITQIYNSAIVVQPENEAARIHILVSPQEENLLIEQILDWQIACPRWELQLGERLPPYHFI